MPPNQREKVRQFIEELLSNMLNGPLDDVSVGQLFNDNKCKFNLNFNSFI